MSFPYRHLTLQKYIGSDTTAYNAIQFNQLTLQLADQIHSLQSVPVSHSMPYLFWPLDKYIQDPYKLQILIKLFSEHVNKIPIYIDGFK